MKVLRIWILVFILTFCALPILSDETATIRSEGGGQIESKNASAGKETAIHNALSKAVRSYIVEIANLTKLDTDKIMAGIGNRLDDYVTGYDLIKESTENDTVRVILDVRVVPERIVKYLLERAGIAPFRNKPVILVALPDDHAVLIAALEKGFIDLGFRVIDRARREIELKSALDSKDTIKIIEISKELGSDLVLTGIPVSSKIENPMLGKYSSLRIEVTMKAIKCEDNQILASGNFDGVTPGLVESAAKKKVAEKIALDIIKDFPRKIMEIWAVGVATGKISLKPIPNSSPPPQIMVDSPDDMKVTTEPAARISATIRYDQGIGEARLFVNDASLALNDSHLTSDADKLSINRIVPLKPGENVISILATDRNRNRAEKKLKVFSDPSKDSESENVTSPRILIYAPADGEITGSTSVQVKGEITSQEDIASVSISTAGTNISVKPEQADSSDAQRRYTIDHEINLLQDRNVVRLTVQTISGIKADKYLTIFVKSSQEQSPVQTPALEKEDNLPVKIKIESPQPDQKISSQYLQIIGEVISSVPMQENVEITVNQRQPSLSRSAKGMKVLSRSKEQEKLSSTRIDTLISLLPGQNDIEIIARTEKDQQYKKSITVSYLPNSEIQPDKIESANHKYAVVIGINKYQDPAIDDLKFASIDAKSIRDLLIDPQKGGFPEGNVRLLIDEQATREAILEAIGEWLPGKVKSGDMVLLFYSGHGGSETDISGEEIDGQNKYLIPYDAKVGNLYSTAILNSTVSTTLERISSNQMAFLIDCCYSGGSTSGSEVIRSVSRPTVRVKSDVYEAFSGSGRVIISASSSDQLSFELPDMGHGLFTYYILKGVDGEADFNKDGTVALVFEMCNYLEKEVSKKARELGFEQTPVLKCQITGDLVFSKTTK